MKQFFSLLIPILIISFISTSCNILNPDNKKTKSELHGAFYDVFLNDTTTVVPEEVFLDGQKLLPDSTGQFSFKLSKGEHTISVESDYHRSLDSTFTVDSLNQSFTFELNPIKDDYFPTKIGSEWVYTGSGGRTSFSGGTRKSFKRKVVWKLISDSISAETNNEIFLFTSTYQDTVITSSLLNVFPPDTLTTNTSSTFQMIIEDGFILFSGNNFFPTIDTAIRGEYGYTFFSVNGTDKNQIIRPNGYYGLPKKYPINLAFGSDILITPTDVGKTGEILMRKGVGFIKYRTGRCCANNTYNFTLELKSFNKEN